MILAFDAKRAFVNSTGLGSYARNHLAMIASIDTVTHIMACTPNVKIRDSRLENSKIQVITPEGVWHVLPSLWRRFRLGKIAQHHKAQIFHGLSAELPGDIARFAGKKVVTVHDVLFKTRPWEYSAFDRRMHDYKLRMALDAADKVVCISRQTLHELLAEYQVDPTKCEVIYQPVHPDFYRAHTFKELIHPPFQKFLLSVGTLEPRKNTLSLLLAVEELNIPLVLIGRIKRAYRPVVVPVLERLTKKGLLCQAQADDIRTLAAWYHHAHLVVYPSLAEGFGLPPLEAAAAGKACVTGPSPCLTEASGLSELQTSGSREDLTAVIQALWNDPQRLSQLSEKAKSHAETLKITSITEIWKSFYTSLLQH